MRPWSVRTARTDAHSFDAKERTRLTQSCVQRVAPARMGGWSSPATTTINDLDTTYVMGAVVISRSHWRRGLNIEPVGFRASNFEPPQQGLPCECGDGASATAPPDARVRGRPFEAKKAGAPHGISLSRLAPALGMPALAYRKEPSSLWSRYAGAWTSFAPSQTANAKKRLAEATGTARQRNGSRSSYPADLVADSSKPLYSGASPCMMDNSVRYNLRAP